MDKESCLNMKYCVPFSELLKAGLPKFLKNIEVYVVSLTDPSRDDYQKGFISADDGGVYWHNWFAILNEEDTLVCFDEKYCSFKYTPIREYTKDGEHGFRSSNVKVVSWAHNFVEYPLEVTFMDGSVYRYAVQDIVLPDNGLEIGWEYSYWYVLVPLVRAESIGGMLRKMVIGKCPYIKMGKDDLA